MYSRSGSRGLPWTSVIDPISRRSGSAAEPGLRRRADGVAGPFDRRAGLRVEPLDLRTAERGRVVVPADADRPAFGQPGDDGIGLGAVAHHVTQVPDRIHIAGVGEDRIERHEVAVDVRQDGDPHRRSG